MTRLGATHQKEKAPRFAWDPRSRPVREAGLQINMRVKKAGMSLVRCEMQAIAANSICCTAQGYARELSIVGCRERSWAVAGSLWKAAGRRSNVVGMLPDYQKSDSVSADISSSAAVVRFASQDRMQACRGLLRATGGHCPKNVSMACA